MQIAPVLLEVGAILDLAEPWRPVKIQFEFDQDVRGVGTFDTLLITSLDLERLYLEALDFWRELQERQKVSFQRRLELGCADRLPGGRKPGHVAIVLRYLPYRHVEQGAQKFVDSNIGSM